MLLEKPSNLKILKVIKRFNYGEVYSHKYWFKIVGNLDSESTQFYLENERIFDYLLNQKQIQGTNWSSTEFNLTQTGEIIKKNLSVFSQIESTISDYPYLLWSFGLWILWWLIWWILINILF